ncbi:MAG: class I SAM-dependent methyltransferase [Candidatus Omnitrophica bacterium]|nr:class I SAM-dependent methyltransferase [Candidatus Omnitrophota bacterium]
MGIKDTVQRWAGFLSPPSPNLNISHKIKELLVELDNQAKLLDIGSGKRRLSCRAINMDIKFFPGVDVIGDAHNPPFKDDYFDLVIARAVIEHVKDPRRTVSQIYRILKKGGCVYAEVPFLQPYHCAPDDFQRYTLSGLENLFKDFKKLDSGFCVGPTGALLGILQEYIALFIGIPIARGIIYFLLGWIFFPLRYLDLLFAKRKKASLIASSLYFLGKK